MGVAFSCPLGDLDDLERRFQSVLVKSISLRDEEIRKGLRSVSYNGRDSERLLLESLGSHSSSRMESETIPSFETSKSDKENMACLKPVSLNTDDGTRMSRSDNSSEGNLHSKGLEPDDKRGQAALRLQKVYKSFRTRRQLADCAVLVEQKWWKLLDFAELRRSSISFFNIERPETAISRWSRARSKAAKVGKGLSKDEKARKLALQHWLEAIDPRHRYGHNLQFYYGNWLHCDSKQPFFYWLDIGDGKEKNLERCPRFKLQQQCIKYLGPKERETYEVVVEDGKLVYKLSEKLLDTRENKDVKWIFVLSTSKSLYVGQKNKGTFQHSSFLAGGATLSAGRLVVEDGFLKAVWPHSGHYLPTEENFEEFMSFLLEQNVDLTNVKKNPTEEGEEQILIRKVSSLRKIQQEAEALHEAGATAFQNEQTADSREQDSSTANTSNQPESKWFKGLLTKLNIPSRDEFFDIFKESSLPRSCRSEHPPSLADDQCLESSTDDGYETAEEILSEEVFTFPKANMSDDEEEEEPVPKEKIMRRIDSHKDMKSYQLAQQLSSKWSTGAGPRISCMRDYPSELQLKVLEQAHLSPRARTHKTPFTMTMSRFSPMVSTPPTPPSRKSGASATKSPSDEEA